MPNTDANALLFKALQTGLELAAARDWSSVTLLEIAHTADLDLKALYELDGRAAITDALDRWADQAMFTDPVDMEDTPRERLFEVIMRRFEALEPFRPGVLSLMKARDKMPFRRAALLGARKRSAHWALVCAGLDGTSGPEQVFNEIGLVWSLRQTELAWRRETDANFTMTMATLDEALLGLEERRDRARRFFSNAPFSQNSKPDAPRPEEPMSPSAPQAESDPA